VSDIQRESQVALNSIKENYFHGAFDVWKKWWDRCICFQGDYLGDGSQNWAKPAFLFFFWPSPGPLELLPEDW
jgi:hypothetical protein